MYPFGRCRVAIGAAMAAVDDGCLGINLILRPGAHGWSRSKRKMARCAGHGFDDVADEEDSGATAQPRYSPRYSPTVALPRTEAASAAPLCDSVWKGAFEAASPHTNPCT